MVRVAASPPSSDWSAPSGPKLDARRLHPSAGNPRDSHGAGLALYLSGGAPAPVPLDPLPRYSNSFQAQCQEARADPHCLLPCQSLCFQGQESEVSIEGFRIWGSPWTPRSWGAFQILCPAQAKEHWAKIPAGVDIVVGRSGGTLDPPFGSFAFCHGVRFKRQIGSACEKERKRAA